MSKDLLNISVNIAGRAYRMKVSSGEEQEVRRAAELINSKIADFQKSYDAKDRQDYLAMAALLYTTEYLKKDSVQESTSEVVKSALSDIEHHLKQIETDSF